MVSVATTFRLSPSVYAVRKRFPNTSISTDAASGAAGRAARRPPRWRSAGREARGHEPARRAAGMVPSPGGGAGRRGVGGGGRVRTPVRGGPVRRAPGQETNKRTRELIELAGGA